MQMKFKKTGAALLVATITVAGSSYAWANENLFDTVDLNEVLNKKETETLEAPKTSTPNTATPVVTEELDIEIPEGFPVGNLAALSKAYENAGNETAKAAIKRNVERAIAKFKAEQTEHKTVNPVVKPVKEEPVVKHPTNETKHATKEERKALQQKQKEERKALQAEHKEEKKALEEEHKAEKQEKKALKEKHKSEKYNAKKHENKKNKDQK